MAYKKWVVRDADKDRASALSEKFNIDPFIAFLLVSRGIKDDLAVSTFLSDSFEMVSPFSFADMDEAVFCIGEAIDNGEKICIYGDYDCDGVTSTALLFSFLKNEGADVCYYIPDRESEGYGLNCNAVKRISEMGVSLIITVDNGISSFEQADYIYELGMKLVITDHHQIGDSMPRAEAIINPHREDNDLPFCDYCGVGVAFKLVCAMYDGDVDFLIDSYIDLVAIGTIADVVPLIYENRAFVRAGLKKINESPRLAIKTFKEMNAANKKYGSTDIAFQLCPRLNAAGRMGDASRAVEFLISNDEDDCRFKCTQLNGENSHRQEIEKNILDDIDKRIKQNPKLVSDRVIVIAGEGYHHGVVGIAAAHILEKYSKPVIIIGVDEQGIGCGSARSVEGFNIYDAICACSDDLIKFGGHPLAAGITLNVENIDLFRKHINEYSFKKYQIMPVQELTIDCKLSPFYLNFDLADSLDALEPYGAMNPQAVFGIYKMKLVNVTSLSKGKHVRMELEKNSRRIHVIRFSYAYDDFPFKTGDLLNLAVKVSKNLYHEKMYLSVQAVDIKLADSDDDKYFSEKNKYELFKLTGKGDKSLYPERDICALVYRYLKANGGYDFGLENLYFRLQDKLSYGQLMFALKAFSQSGLISINNKIIINNIDNKVNLEETQIMKFLKGILDGD